MQLKHIVGAAALAAVAVSAQAEDLTLNIPMVANSALPGAFSGGFGITHIEAGPFTDTLNFVGGGNGFVAASLVTLGFQNFSNINFTSVSLNGQPLTLQGNGTFDTAVLSLTPLSGPFTLLVTGIAAPTLAAGSAIAASYAGTVNISPVPEPSPAAMWLAGLVAMAWLSRRWLAR